MTVSLEAPAPTSNYDRYREAIRVALDQPSHEWSFKSDRGYREVLEHVTQAQGERFLAWARAAQPTLDWELVQTLAELNDSVGQPVTAYFQGLGRFSPSNWRYLCHAIKIWQYADELGLDDFHLIELGGGYGGLALFVDGLRHHFKSRLRNYTIVDMSEAAWLQSRYVIDLQVGPVNVANGLNAGALSAVLKSDSLPRLFFSAYGFSEFAQDVRDWYAERLLRYCEHGLIVWNFPEAVMGTDGRKYGGPVYQFIDKPLSVETDEPRLYAGHQLVRW